MNQIFSTLKVSSISEHILMLTLNRPEVRNAINSQMMQDLYRLWSSLNSKPEQIRCIILTGNGDKAFCAGADLKERYNLPTDVWLQQHSVLQQAMYAMTACEIPIIAAINGSAFGGGLELMLACDFAYAVPTAIFAQPEVKLGIMPGAMGTQNLPRAIGLRRAKEITFSGQSFTSEEALAWGLINKICSSQSLIDEVLEVAQQIADNAPIAVRQAKAAINFSEGVEPRQGYKFEVERYQDLISTQDRNEGVNAFNEKRKPHFIGE